MRAADPPPGVWTDPRVVVGDSVIDGRGLIASTAIATGTVLIELGGRLVSDAELEALLEDAARRPDAAFIDTITVFDGRHLVLPPGTPAHFGNHSCDPTLWHVGPYRLVTRRDVDAGEELTIDYGTNSGARGFAMSCRCGSPTCRGVVTDRDWVLAELQERYGSHWTPALRHRFERRA